MSATIARQPGAATRIVRPVASSAEAAEPQALVVTHWFDSGEGGEPYAATIRVMGQRVGIAGGHRGGDTFVHEEAIDRIVPGSGPVSISSWVYGVAPGEWTVSGELTRPAITNGDGHRRPRTSTEPLQHAAWSWGRWAISTVPPTPVRTRWALPAPLASIPAVIPGSWTVLGALAIAVALATQSAILATGGLSVTSSLLAVVFGLIGAKVWYAILHPGPWRQAILGGWAVDGFLAVALVVGVGVVIALDLPVGAVLDATTPGLFFAVAIGRIGCFLTGCCAGRCTSSRWGIWSSDRRIGARRVPAQLLESAAGLLIGAASLLVVMADAPLPDGLIFAAGFAAYLVARQLLLRLRAERREYSWRRSVLAAAGRPT
jgi:phosphatidylglycerol:prolipoprotein diacylglycerol transferase